MSTQTQMFSRTTMKDDAEQQPIPVPEPYATLPLTVFDRLYDRTTLVIGWLIEGQVDPAALEGALTRLTRKWRVLSGRIESVRNKEKQWRLRVPIADIPQAFPTFVLTSSVSDIPLSKYIPNLDEAAQPAPFQFGRSELVHNHLFMHPSTPLGYAAFESRVHPLTCWHLTHFPASLSNGGRTYTCIGFARCGIFDGEGASLILQALAAEMSGISWAAPPVPNWGVNDNPLQRALDRESSKFHLPLPGDQEYVGFSTLGVFQACRMIWWHVTQRGTKGAEPKVHQLRKNVVKDVLDTTRRDLQEKGYSKVPVQNSDILFSWIITAIYDIKLEILLKGNKDKKIHLNMFASFRHLFRAPDFEDPLDTYPFNASAPVPCPIITYEEACVFSIPNLARLLAVWRSTFSRKHVLSAYETLQRSARAYPFDPSSNETLTLADLTACKFVEMDWTKIGGGATLGMARFHLTPDDFMWTNTVCILGQLPDGGVLLDSILGGEKLERLESKLTSMQLEKELQDGAAGNREEAPEREDAVPSN